MCLSIFKSRKLLKSKLIKEMFHNKHCSFLALYRFVAWIEKHNEYDFHLSASGMISTKMTESG